MPLSIKLWGARGSLPSPSPPAERKRCVQSLFHAFFDEGHREKKDVDAFLNSLPLHLSGGFGGNTISVEVKSDSQSLIIDGGSGIRLLGYDLMKGPCGKGKGRVDLFFTHFHWDHLIGLPFFVPLFIPGNEINICAVQPDLPDIIRSLFKKPYFPVQYADLPSKITFHQLPAREVFNLGNINITPYMLDHPDPCFGFKIQSGSSTYAHCVDTEATRVTRNDLDRDLLLYQGVDLMVFDAQYTLQESIDKVNWGHASASAGIDIAIREGIKKVVFVHHDPAANDEKIFAAELEARRYHNSQVKSARRSKHAIHEVDWEFGFEGMEFHI